MVLSNLFQSIVQNRIKQINTTTSTTITTRAATAAAAPRIICGYVTPKNTTDEMTLHTRT